MKKRLFAPYFLAAAVLLCAVLLDGCQMVKNTDIIFDTSSIAKTQKIEAADANGTKLCTLESREEITAFVEALHVGGWRLAELPKDLEWEGTFTLFQTETATALMDGREPELQELCTLRTYQEAGYLTIDVGDTGLQFTFTMPQEAADYLHGLLK